MNACERGMSQDCLLKSSLQSQIPPRYVFPLAREVSFSLVFKLDAIV